MYLGRMPRWYAVYVTEGNGFYPVEGRIIDTFIFDVEEAEQTAIRYAETVEPGENPITVRVGYDHAELGWLVCWNRQVG